MVLAVVGGLIVVTLGLYVARQKEPEHAGRSLSEWIAIYGPAGGTFASVDEASEAIRAIGTNGLPYLLKWLNFQPRRWQVALETRLPDLPSWLRESTPVQRLIYDDYERAGAAMLAFKALGSTAAPAVPELHRMVCQTNDTSASNRALFALASIGTEAVPAITNILATTPLAGSPFMLTCLIGMGTNAAAAAPALISNLRHPDSRVAAMSANFLSGLRFDPSNAVPALIIGLSDPAAAVRTESARALGAYGTAAHLALPALTNLLGDRELSVREMATNAIKSIPREAGR